jgi:hypothetical protein
MFDDEGALYHFPSTKRAGRDQTEIEATKNAARFHLPVFVVLKGQRPALREVRRGWIAEWDDQNRVFLISFAEELRGQEFEPDEFSLKVTRKVVRNVAGQARPGQAHFRFVVFKRYGARCAMCGLAVPVLLEAVHLCAFSAGGSDDSRNGLVLCRNHHRALDEKLFSLDPASTSVICRPNGPTPDELAIAVESLHHLPALPHREALDWCWGEFVRDDARRQDRSDDETATPRSG